MDRQLLTIMADYGGAWAWRQDSEADRINGVGGSVDGLPAGFGVVPPDLQRRILAWLGRFERDVDPGGPDTSPGFNWDRFNASGLEIAKAIKAIAGDGLRVVYETPYEDWNSRGTNERKEVMIDGSIVAPDMPERPSGS